jgi:hypothetical protein
MARKPVQDFFLFLIGGAVFSAGIFLFASQVMVDSGLQGFGWGRRSFGAWQPGFGVWWPDGSGPGIGLLMIPFGIGVALLFADVFRKLGWFLICAASAAVTVGILQSLVFRFRTASLWSFVSMVVMIAGGAGLMFKSLRDYEAQEREQRRTELEDSKRDLSDIRRELDQLKRQLNREENSD